MEKGDDPYQILGVVSTASEAQIKKAYRYLALRHHPDRQQDDKEKISSHDMFAKISAAFELLMDEESRQAYDNLQQTSKKRGFDAKKVHHKSWDSPYDVFQRDFEAQFGFPYPGADYDWENHEKMASSSSHSANGTNGVVAAKKTSHKNSKPPRTQLPGSNTTGSRAPGPRGGGLVRGHSTTSIGGLLSRSSGHNSKKSSDGSLAEEKAPAKEKRGLLTKMFRGTSFRRSNKYGGMLMDDDDEADNTPVALGSSSTDFASFGSKRSNNRRAQSSRALVVPSSKDMIESTSSRDLMKGSSKEVSKANESSIEEEGDGDNRPSSMKTSTKEIVHKDGTVETVTTTRITRPDGSVETMRTTDKAGKRPGWKQPTENSGTSEDSKPGSKKQQSSGSNKPANQSSAAAAASETGKLAAKAKERRRRSGGDSSDSEARRRKDDDEEEELTWEELKQQMKEEIREELYQNRSDLKEEVRKEMEASGQLSSLDPPSDEEGDEGNKEKKKKSKHKKSSKKSSLDPINETGDATGEKKKKSSKSRDKGSDHLHSSSEFHDSSHSLDKHRKKKKKQVAEAAQ